MCVCERERERERQRQRENLNSKTLILKDNSVRSIWTYLTASQPLLYYTNKHDYTTKRYYKREREERERERGERERGESEKVPVNSYNTWASRTPPPHTHTHTHTL